MPITGDDIKDAHKLREAFRQHESSGRGGSCFGVTDPSHLRPPFHTSPAKTSTEYERALAFRNKIAECFQSFVASGGKDMEAEKEVMQSVPAGLYEHWKSKEGAPKFYVVEHVLIEQDTWRPTVAYAALYAPHTAKLTSRHLLNNKRGFLMPVERDGWSGARFKLVAPLTRRDIDILLQYAGELAVIKDTVKFRLHAGELLKKLLPLF